MSKKDIEKKNSNHVAKHSLENKKNFANARGLSRGHRLSERSREKPVDNGGAYLSTIITLLTTDVLGLLVKIFNEVRRMARDIYWIKRFLRKGNRKSFVTTVSIELLLLTGVLGLHVTLKHFKNGTIQVIPDEQINVTEGFTYPDDSCPKGIRVVKNCPMVLQAIPEVDCWSNKTDFRLTYTRCPNIKREVRSTMVEPVKNLDATIKSIEKRSWHMINNNSILVLCFYVIICVKMKVPIWIIIVVGFLGYKGANGVVIEDYHVFTSDGATMIKVPIHTHEVSTIVGKDAVINIEIAGTKLDRSTGYKRLFQRCDIVGSVSEDTCPGGSNIDMGSLHGDWTDYVCKHDVVSRGWTNGCGLFGTGSVATCLHLSCRDSIDIDILTPGAVSLVLSMHIGSEVFEKEFIHGIPQHIHTVHHGMLTMMCKNELGDYHDTHYLIMEDEKYLRIRESVDSWSGPWKMNGRYHNLESSVAWTTPRSNEISAKSVSFEWAHKLPGDITIGDKGLDRHYALCDVIIDQLTQQKPEECKNFSGKIQTVGEVIDGDRIYGITIQVNSFPCFVPFKCEGCHLTSNGMISTANSSNQFVHVTLTKGKNTFFLGNVSYTEEYATTPIQDGFSKVMKHVKFATRHGAGVLFSTFSPAWFGNFQAIIVGILIMVIGFTFRSMFIVVCGIGLLVFPLVKADFGCGVDFSRQTFSCGTGLFIWNRVGNWDHDMVFSDHDFLVEFVHNKTVEKGGACLVCTDVLECEAYRKLVNYVKLHSYNKNVSYVINTTLSHGRAFAPLNKTIVTVQTATRNYTFLYTRLAQMLDYKAQVNNEVVLYVVTSTAMGDFCKMNITFNFEFRNFVRRIWSSSIEMGLTTSPRRTCPTYLAGAVVKNNLTIHTDGQFWMETVIGDDGYDIRKIQRTESKRCIWPPEMTINPRSIQESELFIPPGMGGPITRANVFKGFKTQTSYPWDLVPQTIERGTCAGTTVEINPECRGRKEAKRSTSADGTIIPRWCCRNCILPPPILKFKEECWYPMEVQPMPNQIFMASETLGDSFSDPVFGALPVGAGFIMGKKEELSGFPILFILYLLALKNRKFKPSTMLIVGWAVVTMLQPVTLNMIFSTAIGIFLNASFALSHWEQLSVYYFVLDGGGPIRMMLFILGSRNGQKFWNLLKLFQGVLLAQVLDQVDFFLVHALNLMVVMASFQAIGGLALQSVLPAICILIGSSEGFMMLGLTLVVTISPFVVLTVRNQITHGTPSMRTTFLVGTQQMVVILLLAGLLVIAATLEQGLHNSLAGMIVILCIVLVALADVATTPTLQLQFHSRLEHQVTMEVMKTGEDLEGFTSRDGIQLVGNKDKDIDRNELLTYGIYIMLIVITASISYYLLVFTGCVIALQKRSIIKCNSFIASFALPKTRKRSKEMFGVREQIHKEHTTTFKRQLENGIYRIMIATIFGTKQKGVGIMKDNVFHTLYHVTAGAPVSIGDDSVLPYYSHTSRDIISYGGNWKFPFKKVDYAQLITIRPNGEMARQSFQPGKIMVDGMEQQYMLIDEPVGTSGSPIIDIDGNVIGLYGLGFNYYGDFGSVIACSDIQLDGQYEQDPNTDDVGGFSDRERKIVDWHPGKGKTWKFIVKFAKQKYLLKERTLILTPTRVVKAEVERALEKAGLQVGKRRADITSKHVTVICHATFYDYWTKNSSTFVKNYVMDEAHFLDPKSIAVRGIMEHEHASRGSSIYFLTATPPGFTGTCDSNYPIEDIPVQLKKESDLINLVSKLEGKTIVFVESAKSGNKLAKQFRNKGAISINRNNFDENYTKIVESKPNLIFSTDISELGANFDVDNVVDVRMCYKPEFLGGAIELVQSPIGHASVNQRRGRVGRWKPGRYFYNDLVDIREEINTMSCWVEAQMLMDQFNGVNGMKEEQVFFESIGLYSLVGEKKHWFFSMITDRTVEIPIWLAWYIAQEPLGHSWMFDGKIELRDIKIKTGKNKGTVVRPIHYDARFFDVDKMENITNYLAKYKRSFVTIPLVQSLLSAITVGGSLTALRNNIDKASALFLNEHVDDVTRVQATEAIDNLMPTLILVGIFLLVVGWKFIGLFRRSKEVVVSRGIDFSYILMLFLLGYMVWVQVAPSIIITMGSIFLVVLPLITREDHHRSYMDENIMKIAIYVGIAVIFIICWELRLMPNITNDILMFNRNFKSRPVTPQEMLSPEVTVPLHSVMAMFVAIMSLYGPVLSSVKVGWLQMYTTAVNTGFKALFGGVNFRGIPWRMFLPAVILSYEIGFVMGTIVVCLAGFVMWIMLLDEKFKFSSRAFKSAESLSNRQPTNDEGIIPDYVNDTIVKNVFHLGVMGIVVLYWFSNPFEMWKMIQCLCFFIVSIRKILWVDNTFTHEGILQASFILASIDDRTRWLGAISAILYMALGSTTLRSMKDETRNSGLIWKSRLNSLGHDTFEIYKSIGVNEMGRGDYVSRGGLKLDEIIAKCEYLPRGIVVDLGCGRGGWSQRVAMEDHVDAVHGFTLGASFLKEKRETPQLFKTFGHNIVNLKEGVDVFRMKPIRANTIMCDIGESDPNPYVEEKRTLRVLDMLEEWLAFNEGAMFCCKILSPYHSSVLRKLEGLQMKYKGRLFRSSHSRNSTMEMYYVSGPLINASQIVYRVLSTLLRRFNLKGAPTEKGNHGPILPLGTKRVAADPSDHDFSKIKSRIDAIKKEHSRTWFVDENHPYRTFKYHGSFATEKRNPGGQAVNGVIKCVMWPWERIYDATKYAMTDVSSFFQQRVLREKVDTKVPKIDRRYAKINRTIMSWLGDLFLKRGMKARILTPEEFVKNLRSDASVGGWSDEIPWETVTEAVNDPVFWDMVEKERKLHLRGDCKLCIYNTMGKKEKKPSFLGMAKGSRTIWFLWLGGRFLEYEALGFLNQDHWVSRENFPCGVGGLGVNYLGYVLKDISTRSKLFIADDVAGWDTRLTRDDLEDEKHFCEKLAASQYHRDLISSVFDMLYMHIVALFPRDHIKYKSETIMDVTSRGDQRGSGQVVTYALNTVTNAKVQLGRLMDDEGIFSPFFNHECKTCGIDGICLDMQKAIEKNIHMWLEKYALEAMKKMAVAGDDVFVGTNSTTLATTITYLNNTGKVRKNIGLHEPSVVSTNWETVEFCSHHYHEIYMTDGRSLIVPCRDQNEVVGRSRIQKGTIPNMAESACLAKAYSQQWALYFFHRRDLRLGHFIINSVVPTHWIPTGRTSWSIHQHFEWMTNEDMLRVWNRVWIYDNPWMKDKTEVTHWGKIPYLHKKQDIICGSLIGEKDRAAWSSEVPNMVHRIRNMVSPTENYSDSYNVMSRYKKDTMM
uniref:Genome polyprotein n=4 Tax=Tabanus rufidens flavivirus TaxID=2734903 RepID=A0A7I8AVY6_9FLAV|nr:polyprotein [Tabanus rufidens flavivirus]